jgi:hypothetical protein
LKTLDRQTFDVLVAALEEIDDAEQVSLGLHPRVDPIKKSLNIVRALSSSLQKLRTNVPFMLDGCLDVADNLRRRFRKQRFPLCSLGCAHCVLYEINGVECELQTVRQHLENAEGTTSELIECLSDIESRVDGLMLDQEYQLSLLKGPTDVAPTGPVAEGVEIVEDDWEVLPPYGVEPTVRGLKVENLVEGDPERGENFVHLLSRKFNYLYDDPKESIQRTYDMLFWVYKVLQHQFDDYGDEEALTIELGLLPLCRRYMNETDNRCELCPVAVVDFSEEGNLMWRCEQRLYYGMTYQGTHKQRARVLKEALRYLRRRATDDA